MGTGDSLSRMELKQPEGVDASFRLRNDVVYEVNVDIFFKDELTQALIEKYGAPGIKVGGIRKVTCKNNFGASFERLSGKEELRWKVKDGVQGAIERLAGDCGQLVIQSYILRHLATITAVEGGKAEQARKNAEEARRKLGNAF